MSKSLYTKDDEIVIEAKIPATAEPTVEELNSDLMKDIKEIVTGEKKVTKSETYFTPTKGKAEFYLDNSTAFKPSSLVRLSPKRFEELYLKQLESIVLTDKEEIDSNHLLQLVYLFSHVNKKNYPIRIVTSEFSKSLSKVCSVLNTFMNKNYHLCYSLYTTLNSFKTSEEEQHVGL